MTKQTRVLIPLYSSSNNTEKIYIIKLVKFFFFFFLNKPMPIFFYTPLLWVYCDPQMYDRYGIYSILGLNAFMDEAF